MRLRQVRDHLFALARFECGCEREVQISGPFTVVRPKLPSPLDGLSGFRLREVPSHLQRLALTGATLVHVTGELRLWVHEDGRWRAVDLDLREPPHRISPLWFKLCATPFTFAADAALLVLTGAAQGYYTFHVSDPERLPDWFPELF